MHVSLIIVSALVLGTLGVPDEIGGGFSFSSRGAAGVSSAVQATIGNGRVSTNATGSAAGRLKSRLRGGAYLDSNGKIIGINGGLSNTLEGTAHGNATAEVVRNNDGTFTTKANGHLNSTSNVGVSGHGNLATGSEERRQVAVYKGEASDDVVDGEGSVIQLGPLVSAASNIVEHFWLYFWIGIGCFVIITSCCVLAVCAFYWKLVGDVKKLGVEKYVKQVDEKEESGDKHTVVEIGEWDSKVR